MNRDALGVVAIAAVAILAIAVGAAAIDTPTRSGGSGPGAGGGSGAVPGNEWVFDLGQSTPEAAGAIPFPSWLLSALAIAVLVAFLASLYVLRDELGMDELKAVVVLSAVFGAVLTVVYVLLQFLSGSGDTENGSGAFGEDIREIAGGGGSGSLDSAARNLTADPPLLALAAVGALLVGTAVLVRSGRTTDENGDDSTQASSGPGTPAELGRAAGRAADRIASEASVDNEVYRAWREMTDQVGVGDPASRTPGEFARAATDAGMAHEDIAELTDLFRTVRYGDTEATDGREARAMAALRRIENEYAEEP